MELEDAAVLLRGDYEGFVCTQHVQNQPEMASDVFEGKRIRGGGKRGAADGKKMCIERV